MVNSKQKGARFERELAKMFKAYGYDARRMAQYCGNTGDAADIDGVPYIHIEAKHQETMHLYEWLTQAVNDAKKKGRIPAVFHKKNNHPVIVSMLFDDWMQIYREYEASMQLTELENEKRRKLKHD